ncbi:MAG: VWA-like domain-containing protein [Opitutaceae bacterium]|nr:VWA-like domain-containing protein [Opitutaceae bacterium]
MNPAVSLHAVEQMFRAARLLLLARYPFYGSLLAHLKPILTDRVPTAAVDACDRVFLNPEFFAALEGVEQRAFILAHEALHPALGIFWRGRSHDPVLSNLAHDFVINLILRDDNPRWLPKTALIDDRFAGKSYEEVYGELVRKSHRTLAKLKLPMADVMPSGPAGVIGEESPSRSAEAEDPAGRMRVWQTRVVAARLYAQAQGRASRGAERAAGLSRGSTVPWQEKLRLALHEAFGRARTDWSRPHRRGCALGLYLPREVFHGCDCAVYVDTSGSISPDNLAGAVREVDGIIRACGGRVRWLQGDDGVLGDEWIQAAPETLSGGGGTSFVPLFSHLSEGTRPHSLVIFTDTFGTMPASAPEFPVIWAVYGETENEIAALPVPFGEKIAVPAHAFAART